MASSATPRPLSVTVFGWLVVLGSAFIVLSAFEQVSALSSLDTRRQVQEFLSEPPGDGLGLGVETTLDLLHVLSVITGGCAAAAAVLGVYVLRRSRNARWGLTVVVVPMFVAGLALGGILTAMVAAGAIAMWLQPARDWFNGVNRPEQPRGPFGRSSDDAHGAGPGGPGVDGLGPDPHGQHGSGEHQHGDQPAGDQPAGDQGEEKDPEHESARREQPVSLAAGSGGSPEARAYVGFGQPGAGPAGGAPTVSPGQEQGQRHDQQQDRQQDQQSGEAYWSSQPFGSTYGGPYPGQQAPWGQPAQAAPPGKSTPARPAAVLVAVVVTWATCAIVGTVMLATIAMLAAAPDFLMEEMRRQNPELGTQVAESTLVSLTIAVGVVLVLWCVAASVAAIFVLRRHAWARIALAVSAVVAALGCLLLAVGSVAMLLPSLAAATTAYCLLLRPEVRAWFAAR